MKALLSKFNLATLFAILILLNLVDAVTTTMLVNQYGPNVEVNPILRELIYLYGVAALFGFKYFLISILGIMLLALKQIQYIMVARNSLFVINFMYLCVVVYNTILVYLSINI